ncbi:hypothetical protein GQ43DRAFT_437444 [Delitschia confertaspora ATCC 74209]|uniref:polynucleotide adenylyltransferase n=1 Tax=Delitschia confertaspora ATCC 74209 TaxID=1513339 RepID=A0A9P4MT95_9PLEO|nr:hypothetical protein GQ43DRAFT_437444 [Delitschia confertaspora ATCC 74209]
MGDSYRPGQQRRNGLPPRPGPGRPLDERITRGGGNSSFQFGQEQSSNSQKGEFSFRSNVQAPQFTSTNSQDAPARRRERINKRRGGDHWGAGQHRSNSSGRSRNSENSNRSRSPLRSNNGTRGGRGGRRGGFRNHFSKKPHERPLLQAQDDSTTEQILGVAESSNRFLDLDDLSVSEGEMDFDSDSGSPAGPVESKNGGEDEAAQKKTRMDRLSRADGDSVPKWSNPDPYTVLPPPDETTGKKKDFVQLIRKAKIAQEAEKAMSRNAVAENDDFISFGNEAEDGPVVGSLNDLADPSKKLSTHQADPPATLPYARENAPKPTHKRKRGEGEGAIVSQWLRQPRLPATPWCKTDYTRIDDIEKLLHNEILDFYDFVKPHDHEKHVRAALIDRVQDVFNSTREFSQGGTVKAFGSFPAGLFLPTADMDLVFLSDQYERGGYKVYCTTMGTIRRHLWAAANALKHRGVAIGDSINVITKAKVPIVKFVDSLTRLHVDISFETANGVEAQDTFKEWKKSYPDMPILVALVKQFLVMRGLNEVHTGGLGGFSVICLVVSFLHLQGAGENLGQTFLNFLDFYGNQFDLNSMRISLNPHQYEAKGRFGVDDRPEREDRLSITDPNDQYNNISGGSDKVAHIFKLFSQAHNSIRDRMKMMKVKANRAPRDSVLDPVFGGNYQSYIDQREHLMSLAE